MKTSDSISTIAAALLKAQKAIGFAAKDAKNPHFKSTYADLPAVVDAVKPSLNEAGIVFIQSAGPSDDGRLNLTTRLLHESGEWIEDTLTMPLPKHDPQGYGSAMTYARRYALAAITGLYQDDDDGNAASGVSDKQKPDAQQKPKGLSDKEKADWNAAIEEAANDSIDVLREVVGKASRAAKEVGDTTAYNHFRNKGSALAQRYEGANA